MGTLADQTNVLVQEITQLTLLNSKSQEMAKSGTIAMPTGECHNGLLRNDFIENSNTAPNEYYRGRSIQLKATFNFGSTASDRIGVIERPIADQYWASGVAAQVGRLTHAKLHSHGLKRARGIR